MVSIFQQIMLLARSFFSGWGFVYFVQCFLLKNVLVWKFSKMFEASSQLSASKQCELLSFPPSTLFLIWHDDISVQNSRLVKLMSLFYLGEKGTWFVFVFCILFEIHYFHCSTLLPLQSCATTSSTPAHLVHINAGSRSSLSFLSVIRQAPQIQLTSLLWGCLLEENVHIGGYHLCLIRFSHIGPKSLNPPCSPSHNTCRKIFEQPCLP